ncbi:NAD(P)/FAD-dependent oxidoreductase [Kordiimonas sp. SCSIO 12610]|uniref:NAD(P)/FAD-dependent oxidoreductase n=1 Tax=Kordiimonas sp. SCSIO 12610 TaxID=2829597 RepID=UPI00210C308E|nr:NAD(P)/FAD-dependent oxidoreductase [Kordiimonas sp. SCSIO 12610]UTW55645.1 NAD(P)/FAD-dependent oxidoreductase [Kordiimonas sp. SCSIO 12610]
MQSYDVIVIGAGAAGLMCALTAGQRGKTVLLLEHGKKAGAKILISGGGRCNFTNEDVKPENYISRNPHFAKSALARYTPWDFMGLLASHGVTWHEKKLGQLFCDQGAKRILKVLLDECQKAHVQLRTEMSVKSIKRDADHHFILETSSGNVGAKNLIIATGGPSIPKMGATGFAYEVAEQFELALVKPEPALVPFVFDAEDKEFMKSMAGVAVDANVFNERTGFRENILFTHRGLSGPAILQISSYWQSGEAVSVNLLPTIADGHGWLVSQKKQHPKQKLKSILEAYLPARLNEALVGEFKRPIGEISNMTISTLADQLTRWHLSPTGTEGYAKAEVTKGGIDTDALSSRTMECKTVPGLYFIGEAVDVTGWLGGYNFQWAWASGHAAGQAVI